MTRGAIENRIKKLQTGNSEDIRLVDSFRSKNPFFIESSLHRYFSDKQIINEWYQLSDEDVENFQDLCRKYENINETLTDNPFFKN